MLQKLCREYLSRLKDKAQQYGLSSWLQDIIEQNNRNECSATEEEVEMLSRILDEERIVRTDVPKILGKSYRQCVDDEDFDNIKHLPYVGIYSKVSTLLYKFKKQKNGKK